MSTSRLTLDTLLVPKEAVSNSPSQKDGLTEINERSIRLHSCSLIQSASVLLQLPQEASATAQIIFQRFYYQKSFISDNYYITAMACVVIAAKVEEFIRRIRDITNVFHFLEAKLKEKEYIPMDLDEYKSLKQRVIRQELRILTALGYNVRVNHPHKIIFIYLNMLKLGNETNLVQSAWNYMNDALRSPTIFPCHKPEIVACACICLAARNQFIPLPTDPHWFELFNARSEEILEIVRGIIDVYKYKLKTKDIFDALNEIKDIKNFFLLSKKAKSKSPQNVSSNSPPFDTKRRSEKDSIIHRDSNRNKYEENIDKYDRKKFESLSSHRNNFHDNRSREKYSNNSRNNDRSDKGYKEYNQNRYREKYGHYDRKYRPSRSDKDTHNRSHPTNESRSKRDYVNDSSIPCNNNYKYERKDYDASRKYSRDSQIHSPKNDRHSHNRKNERYHKDSEDRPKSKKYDIIIGDDD